VRFLKGNGQAVTRCLTRTFREPNLPSQKMSRRVLIVVSAYCPAMLADMHRARMLALELPKVGWEVEILTPRASEVRQDVIEPHAAKFFPYGLPTHEVGSFVRELFEKLGSRTHSWRTVWPIHQKGTALLKTRRFDLVYFSTTTWLYFALGARWRRKLNVPYVLDFHDPWVKEQSKATSEGQSWKSRAAESLGGRLERSAVINAAGLVSVSPKYIKILEARYKQEHPAWLAAQRHAVIPFGALEGDLEETAGNRTTCHHHIRELRVHYVGAGGTIMLRSFTLICRILSALREEGNPLVDQVRIQLFGTTYGWKPGNVKHLEQAAHDAGVGDLVREHPERVSYRRSLELLLESDGALILGVDDEGYMPSKLFTYALSGKPLLASLHRASPAFGQLSRLPALGHVLWFGSGEEMAIADATSEFAIFLEEAAARRSFDRGVELKPFLAPAMARRHAELFEACV
jgi:hypothetical protein